MKTMISSFGNAVLSREQMKNVIGGKRLCVAHWTGPNGEDYQVQENCGRMTTSECMQAASNKGINTYGMIGTAESYQCELV